VVCTNVPMKVNYKFIFALHNSVLDVIRTNDLVQNLLVGLEVVVCPVRPMKHKYKFALILLNFILNEIGTKIKTVVVWLKKQLILCNLSCVIRTE
jgi:hypothetical protein